MLKLCTHIQCGIRLSSDLYPCLISFGWGGGRGGTHDPTMFLIRTARVTQLRSRGSVVATTPHCRTGGRRLFLLQGVVK